MKKIQVIGVAFIAMLGLSAFLASTASATLWLQGGASLPEARAATWHLKIIVIHTAGMVGTGRFECSVLLIGTVGPGPLDLVQLVESLTGERDLILCHIIEGLTNCETLQIHALNLSWLTLLELINGVTWDHFVPEPGMTGQPGWDVLCRVLGIELLVLDCVGLQRLRFTGNGPNGALFEDVGSESGSDQCSDGGTSVTIGTGEVLGFQVS